MQPANQLLKAAYDRVQLAQHGVSFDAALADPMFKTCLGRIAQAIEKPNVPLPTHPCAKHWQDKD